MANFIGKKIAKRYRVESLIGRGGMGDVYKVWDDQRSVFLAMKVLHADLAEDVVFLRRFKREADTLSALQHPHIVRFYGLEQDDELTFMLMDYVDGTTLRKQIFDLRQQFPYQRIPQIIRPVCSALSFAHQMGCVHCDIKPANIMVESSGRVLVADFGVARMLESSTTMTTAGVGTPAYMAPEQVKSEKPTPQTDIYALGIVLYEMLTGGERPFAGERARIEGSIPERVRWEQVELEPPSPREFNPAISLELEKVVLKCLEKDPANRYANAMELLNAVEFALGDTKETALIEQPVGRAVTPSSTPASGLPREEERTRKPAALEGRKVNLKSLLVIGGIIIALLMLFFIGKSALVNSPASSALTQILYTTPEVSASTSIPPTPISTFTPFPPTYTPPPLLTPTFIFVLPTATDATDPCNLPIPNPAKGTKTKVRFVNKSNGTVNLAFGMIRKNEYNECGVYSFIIKAYESPTMEVLTGCYWAYGWISGKKPSTAQSTNDICVDANSIQGITITTEWIGID